MRDEISELSSRSEHGLDVALLWCRRDNTAFVVVVERSRGASFELDVRRSHPYAYAAHRHIDRIAA